MPKRKKRHGISKMTKEEKIALWEAKKLAARLEAEETARHMKRDRLARELEYVHLHWKMLKRKWREEMLKIKVPEFRKDVEIAYGIFDRTMDLKDYTISCLLEELDHADLQHHQQLSGYCENIELILRIMGERLSEAHLDYESEVNDALVGNDMLNHTMDSLMSNYERRINLAIYIREQRWHEFLSNEMAEYGAQINDATNTLKLRRELRQSDLERQLEEVYNDMANYLKEHLEKYREQSLAYERLKKADSNGAQFIQYQILTIQECTDKIADLKKDLSERESRKKLAVTDLQNEFQFFNQSYRTLRNRFNDSIKKDDIQLVHLTNESKKSENKLKEIKSKGEKILSLLSICRKHETQMEKILPFPIVTPLKDLKELYTYFEEYKPSSDECDFKNEFISIKTKISDYFETIESEKWAEDQGFQTMKKLLKPWGYSGPGGDSVISDSYCKFSDRSSSKGGAISLEGSVLKEVKSEEGIEMEESSEDIIELLKVPALPEMEKFWQRVGAMEISRAAVIEEHEELLKENLFLKEQLRRYLSYLPFQREVCDPTGGYPLAKRVLVSAPRDIRNCLCLEYCICSTKNH